MPLSHQIQVHNSGSLYGNSFSGREVSNRGDVRNRRAKPAQTRSRTLSPKKAGARLERGFERSSSAPVQISSISPLSRSWAPSFLLPPSPPPPPAASPPSAARDQSHGRFSASLPSSHHNLSPPRILFPQVHRCSSRQYHRSGRQLGRLRTTGQCWSRISGSTRGFWGRTVGRAVASSQRWTRQRTRVCLFLKEGSFWGSWEV